ncbi:MAG TPA: DUF2017 domain-containing protein [Enteractinococcus helveticum]|uniref:DUF2017 domain-containing protein n=1 Tax=Enteractinococcus helveticum TaxID=1837282 RepID=A0A921FPG2_9MICC|nr:DUF2017 family protein [Enteractinococcus helveticum]HJF14516.1 DUF2017 domain-containing protein [Enteractinococcus helveticum]
MALAFKSTLRGYSAFLEKPERQILRSLFSDVLTLLGGVSPADQQLDDDKPRFRDRFRTGESLRLPRAPGPAEAASSTDDAFWNLVGTLTDEVVHLNLDDPAVKRLLPDARSGDDAHHGSEQFRQLAQDDIRQQKITDLQRAYALLQSGSLMLNRAEAESFSRALNQVRLVLSSRLKITDEQDAERVHAIGSVDQATDVESYMALLYNFVSWLQETLMQALIGDIS